MYYDNNLTGTITLLQVMADHGCKRLVFSSSCTVYGTTKSPLSEDSPFEGEVTNAYAATKKMMEQILFDIQRCDPTWAVVILRYFNPVGAHPSGECADGDARCGSSDDAAIETPLIIITGPCTSL